MNRTLEEATVKRHRPESRDQLRKHLGDFVAAYNVARRLNTLKGLTPYERSLVPFLTCRRMSDAQASHLS